MAILTKILLSIFIIIAAIIAHPIITHFINKTASKTRLKDKASLLTDKIVKTLIIISAIILLIAIWGFGVENIWLMATSILALVAIGFVAVWSILSNVIATLLIFIYKPFKINDKIEIMPEGIAGTVSDINTMFVTLKDEKENLIRIPSIMVFQKIVKKLAK